MDNLDLFVSKSGTLMILLTDGEGLIDCVTIDGFNGENEVDEPIFYGQQ
jgi:hypothetical protein